LGVPEQLPPEQASLDVQALPSSHPAEFAGCVQDPLSQTSSVQGLESSVQAPELLLW